MPYVKVFDHPRTTLENSVAVSHHSQILQERSCLAQQSKDMNHNHRTEQIDHYLLSTAKHGNNAGMRITQASMACVNDVVAQE